jgi:hypothetical protein
MEMNHLRRAVRLSTSPAKSDPLMIPLPGFPRFEYGPYFGMASVTFPSISTSNLVEDGLFCKGCWELWFNRTRLPDHIIAAMVPPNRDRDQVVEALRMRAYSARGFLEHIRHCSGIQHILFQGEEPQ